MTIKTTLKQQLFTAFFVMSKREICAEVAAGGEPAAQR
jgi:hypothetical protein